MKNTQPVKTGGARSTPYIAMAIALFVATSFIRVPFFPVPFTLQTLAVMLAGFLLGAWRAAAAAGVYILMGLLGLPVFVSGGGFSYVLQPTFGYMPGFLAAAALCGGLRKRVLGSLWKSALAAFAGGVLILFTGTVYGAALLYFTTGKIDAGAVAVSYFLLFLPAEAVKSLAAAFAARALKKAGFISLTESFPPEKI
jgi:biotin transport system substrate-specific component